MSATNPEQLLRVKLAVFIPKFTLSNTIEEAGTTNIAKVVKEFEMKKDKTAIKRLEYNNLDGEQ